MNEGVKIGRKSSQHILLHQLFLRQFRSIWGTDSVCLLALIGIYVSSGHFLSQSRDENESVFSHHDYSRGEVFLNVFWKC